MPTNGTEFRCNTVEKQVFIDGEARV